MERFNALGRGAQVMLVGAVLLFIDLFLPWQDFDIGGIADEFGVDATFSGWRGIGVILGIVTIVLIAWLLARLAAVDLPLPVSAALTSAFLAALVFLFGIIKMLTILGDETTIWSWIGLVLAIAVGVGGWLTVQEAGGVAQMRSEVSSMTTPGTTVPPSAPPPPAAPSAPPVAEPPETTPVAEPPEAAPEPAPERPPAERPDEPGSERPS